MEALALAGGARRRLSAREEELLGLLAGFPDGAGECGSDRELSFSDLVEAGARPNAEAAAVADPAPAPAPVLSSPGQHELAAKQQRQQAARQRARRGSRGSFGGSGDGVLLNFYVPGLLARSMTAPRPGRGPLSPGAGQGAPPKASAAAAAAAGKASRARGPLGIGCWPALWGRDRRRPSSANACV
ncbi:translation initiation factor IF-2-like isoform X2 [Panicum virgatum]|uniref:translation initiation factor IF-2-like isoform X2 n=1 Tax=Panicum virgatum TaxID=38727 RepID=UPI0019D54ADD|nr:translation initiation factor IF-2-like isoform X2 [Panicum virgatum]